MTDLLTPDIPEGDIAFVPDQIQLERSDAEPDRRQRRAAAMKPIMWRLHFLGGFLAGPIILALCISGIMYAWFPQIDDIRFGSIMHQSSSDVSVSLADQVAAAEQAYPDWTVYAVTPGSGGDNTMVTMDPPGGEPGFGGPADAELVYVDQATGEVTGAITQENTTDNWTRTLHSSLRLGPNAELLTELAGSWFLVTLATGVYLWWPGLRRRGSMAFAARRDVNGRRRDKDWHNFIGIGLLVPMFFVAATGLTWTQFAGDRVDVAKEQLAVPSGGAEAALPAEVSGNSSMANIDTVYATATAEELVAPIRIVVPTDDATGWAVASRDTKFPVERDELTVDGTTGEITSSYAYSEEHWFNKLRTAAILFHQAQLFGVPLQLFMTALASAVAYLVFLGYRMWWRRRPDGGLGTPPPIRSWLRSAPLPILAAVLVLGYLMPVLALSLGVWLILEAGWRWYGALRDPAPATAIPHRLGQALTAGVLVVAAVAMLATLDLGRDIEEPGTFHRLAIWAWSWPLALVFLGVGVVGLLATLRTARASAMTATTATT